MELAQPYRFNLRTWLMNLPLKKRKQVMDLILQESGQSKPTIKRIMYMKTGDTTYVRSETKQAICDAFGKTVDQLENAATITRKKDERV